MTARFIIHTNPDLDERQNKHWTYQSGNGQTTCTSENVVNRSDIVSTIMKMKEDVPTAPIYTQLGDEEPELFDAGLLPEPSTVEAPTAVVEPGGKDEAITFKLMQGPDMRWSAFAQLGPRGGVYFGPSYEDVNEVQALVRALQAADVSVQSYSPGT